MSDLVMHTHVTSFCFPDVKCPSFRGIASGSVTETDATATTPQYVTFECDTGYRREGSAVLGCVDGKWNGTAPTCKRKTTYTKTRQITIIIWNLYANKS